MDMLERGLTYPAVMNYVMGEFQRPSLYIDHVEPAGPRAVWVYLRDPRHPDELIPYQFLVVARNRNPPPSIASYARSLFDEFSVVLERGGVILYVHEGRYNTSGSVTRQAVMNCIEDVLSTREAPPPGGDCQRHLAGGVVETLLDPLPIGRGKK
jgi:hypothetical protein